MAHNIRRFNVVLPPIHRPYRMLPIGSTAVLINAMVNHRMKSLRTCCTVCDALS